MQAAHYSKIAAMVFALLLMLAAPASFEESFRSGLLALQRNDLNAAAYSLEEAAKLAPDNARVWVALAQTYRKRKEKVKADAAATKAEGLAGADPVVFSTLAIYYEEAGQRLKAAEAQARYAELSPGDRTAREGAESLFFEAAQALLKQQKFAEAVTILSTGTKHLKNSAQLTLALGVAYYGLRRFDDAAGAFLHTIEIGADTDQPYIFLGKFLEQIPGRLPEITNKFIAYEAANPERPLGYYLHAKALNAQSIEPDTAQALLERALAIDDRDAAAHFELGALFDRTQRFDQAARELERAAALAPDDPATHYRLARVYDRLGKPDAARAERDRHTKLEQAQRDAIR